jgi:hypothetical protein
MKITRKDKRKVQNGNLQNVEMFVNPVDEKVYYKDVNGQLNQLAIASEVSTEIDDDVSTALNNLVYEMTIKLGDESTAHTTGIKTTFYAPFDMTISDAMGGVVVQGTSSGATVIDIHVSGTTIMPTNKIQIEFGEDTSLTAATQPGVTATAVSKGDKIELEIDTLSGGATEAGGVVTIYYTRV